MTETLLAEAGAEPDVAAMATGFGIALHDAGLPVGPDRCERLARAVTVMGATTVAELRACALATMVSDPGQMPTFDRVFAAVFGGPSPFRHLNLPNAARSYERPEADGSPQPPAPPPLSAVGADGSKVWSKPSKSPLKIGNDPPITD